MVTAPSHMDPDPSAPPIKIAMPFDGSAVTNDAGDDPTGEERERTSLSLL